MINEKKNPFLPIIDKPVSLFLPIAGAQKKFSFKNLDWYNIVWNFFSIAKTQEKIFLKS